MNELEPTLRQKYEDLLKSFDPKAVIFDLDGTLLDNNPYHLSTWITYLNHKGRNISETEYNANINGRTNKDVIEYIYGRKLEPDEIEKYGQEKEALYRKIYQPFIQPVKGLIGFLDFLQQHQIPIAIATSGIQPNIDFMFEHVPIQPYFKVVVNSSHIKRGKPDPEIYLKAASLLGVDPLNCLVFEDAIVGIHSAKSAGMKVIAIATTLPRNELGEADRIINNYEF